MIKHCLVSLAAIGFAVALAGPASATTCPKDKMGVDIRPMADNPASGVTDEVRAHIDLSKEPAAVQGRMLRLRKLVVQPGGVVPWHSHGNRPAIILITKGEITEYASNCSVGVVHKHGDAVTETNPTAHWWKNESKQPAELYSADLFPTEMMGKPEEQHM